MKQIAAARGWIPKGYKGNREFILATVQDYGFQDYGSIRLPRAPEQRLKSPRRRAEVCTALQFASYELRNNDEIVLPAVRKTPYVLIRPVVPRL